MSSLATIRDVDIPAALATVPGVASLKRGIYGPGGIGARPGLFYAFEHARMKGSTNKHMTGKLRLWVGAWVDVRNGWADYNAIEAGVQTAMFSADSNPNWWSETRAGDEWWFMEPEEGEELAGFLFSFDILFDHLRTAP